MSDPEPEKTPQSEGKGSETDFRAERWRKRSDAIRMAKPPGSRKASIAAIEQRVGAVLELLMRGGTRRQVVQYAASNWQVSSRMADEYISRANEMIMVDAAASREKSIAHAINRMKRMFAKNYDTDQRLSLEIAKEIHRIQGVYPAEKSDLKITASSLDEMSEAQLARTIRDAEIADAEIKRLGMADGK